MQKRIVIPVFVLLVLFVAGPVTAEADPDEGTNHPGTTPPRDNPTGPVVVDTNGVDNFSNADYYGIANNSSDLGIASVTIDISIVSESFFDFDGGSGFGAGLAPEVTSGNYTGAVTWVFEGEHSPFITAEFVPPMAANEYIRFGADTDFFLSDPCPGGNFGAAPASVSVTFSDGSMQTGEFIQKTDTESVIVFETDDAIVPATSVPGAVLLAVLIGVIGFYVLRRNT